MPAAPARKGIKDLFYETRVLMGRDFTLRRFATEILGGSIDPVMLGYIEKGKRFPNEALVRRLATVRKQDAHELLALLWRDRMLYAFGRELRRVQSLRPTMKIVKRWQLRSRDLLLMIPRRYERRQFDFVETRFRTIVGEL